MAIYRLPRDISFVDPAKSMCPNCRHSLGAADLVPLLSWLLLRGKCRYCKVQVSPRYMLVELLTGGLWAGVWWQYLVAGQDWMRAIAYSFAMAGLIAVFFIDWETFEIPDSINAYLLVIGLVYHAFAGTIVASLWGAFAGWAIIWGIAVFGRLAFRKDAMGHGDILLMRGVGAIVGPSLVFGSIAMAVVAGALLGVVLLLLNRRSKADEPTDDDEVDMPPETLKSLFLHGIFYLVSLDVVGLFWPKIYAGMEKALPGEPLMDSVEWKPSLTHIPFGPYLALGTIICMLFPRPIESAISDYLSRINGDVAIHQTPEPLQVGGNGVETTEYSQFLNVRETRLGTSLAR